MNATLVGARCHRSLAIAAALAQGAGRGSPVRLLVVEDHTILAEAIATALREAGWAVDVTGDGEEAIMLGRRDAYDVIVLDLNLPSRDGLSVLRAIRGAGAEAGVLILTARETLQDRVGGLDAGADDYLVKPFALEELLARVRALLRRRFGVSKPSLTIADLRIDTRARRVWRADAEVRLSAREYAVLECLALRRGQIVSRDALFEHIYDLAAEPGSNVLDVHISNLRRKIDRGSDRPLIHTFRGQGYMLDEHP